MGGVPAHVRSFSSSFFVLWGEGGENACMNGYVG